MKKLKFYRCQHCGNLVIKLVDSGVPMICCGEVMQELLPNTVEASAEKHLPVVKVQKSVVEVSVGSVPHPMTPEHFITFILLETENGFYVKDLTPKDKPEAVFACNEKPVAVYAFCNLHSLWKSNI